MFIWMKRKCVVKALKFALSTLIANGIVVDRVGSGHELRDYMLRKRP